MIVEFNKSSFEDTAYALSILNPGRCHNTPAFIDYMRAMAATELWDNPGYVSTLGFTLVTFQPDYTEPGHLHCFATLNAWTVARYLERHPHGPGQQAPAPGRAHTPIDSVGNSNEAISSVEIFHPSNG